MASKKYPLSDKELWYKIESDFSKSGGIYKLFCLDNNDQIIRINRLLKTDRNGILYIGKTTSFLDRVINLKKSISPDYNSDSRECGVRYKSSDFIKAKFPFQNLIIELNTYENTHSAEKEY